MATAAAAAAATAPTLVTHTKEERGNKICRDQKHTNGQTDDIRAEFKYGGRGRHASMHKWPDLSQVYLTDTVSLNERGRVQGGPADSRIDFGAL